MVPLVSYYSHTTLGVSTLEDCKEMCSEDPNCGMFRWESEGRWCDKYQMSVEMWRSMLSHERYLFHSSQSSITGSRACTAITIVNNCQYNTSREFQPRPVTGWISFEASSLTPNMCKFLCSLYPTCMGAWYRQDTFGVRCHLYHTTITDVDKCWPEDYIICDTYMRDCTPTTTTPTTTPTTTTPTTTPTTTTPTTTPFTTTPTTPFTTTTTTITISTTTPTTTPTTAPSTKPTTTPTTTPTYNSSTSNQSSTLKTSNLTSNISTSTPSATVTTPDRTVGTAGNTSDHCSVNPCQHGGICHYLVSSYKCQCRLGFTGTNCEGIWTWIVLSIVLVVVLLLLGICGYVYYVHYKRRDFTFYYISSSDTKSTTPPSKSTSPKTSSPKSVEDYGIQNYSKNEIRVGVAQVVDQDGVGVDQVVDQDGVGVDQVVDQDGVGVDNVEDRERQIPKVNDRDEYDEAEYREVRFYLESEWEFG